MIPQNMPAMDNPGTAAPPRRVVFFGDSRADWWLTPQIPGVVCINRGVPGASSGYLLQQCQALVARLQPESVVVQAGVNDLVELAWRRQNGTQLVAATARNIVAIVERVRALGARVVLTTIFPLAHGPLEDPVVQQAIGAINGDLLRLMIPGVQVFDSAAVLTGPDGYVRAMFADDEVHLSAAGYAALNGALVPLLVQGVN